MRNIPSPAFGLPIARRLAASGDYNVFAVARHDDGETLITYVEDVLVPTLRSGDIIDNLAGIKAEPARLVRAVGVKPFFRNIRRTCTRSDRSSPSSRISCTGPPPYR